MKTIAVIAIAMLALGCAQRSDICTPVPDISADMGPESVDAMAKGDPVWLERRAANCLHRWGYRLASSKDEGLTVAKAVMQACEEAVRQHADAHATGMADQMQQSYAPGVVGVVERGEYADGRRAEKLAQLGREAHFRVQTARAGNCKA